MIEQHRLISGSVDLDNLSDTSTPEIAQYNRACNFHQLDFANLFEAELNQMRLRQESVYSEAGFFDLLSDSEPLRSSLVESTVTIPTGIHFQ